MQLNHDYIPGLKTRVTKASVRNQKKVIRNRRGLYAAAAFASVATASLGVGGAAHADTAPPAEGGLLTQVGNAVGTNLDPGARSQLESALSGVASITDGSPLANPVSEFAGAVRGPAGNDGPLIRQAAQPTGVENEGVASNGGTGRAPAAVEEIAGTVSQVVSSGLDLKQIGAWAEQVPDGPLRQPVQDLLAFVSEATQMAGSQRRDSRGTVIDDLIQQARQVFDFPQGGDDPTKALRELLEPVATQAAGADWSPVLEHIAPALREAAAGTDIKTVLTEHLTPLLQSGPLADAVRPVIMQFAPALQEVAPTLTAVSEGTLPANALLGALEQVLRSGTLAASLAPFAGFLAPVLSAVADPGSALGAALSPVRDGLLQAVRALMPTQLHDTALPLVLPFLAIPIFVAILAAPVIGIVVLGLAAAALAAVVVGALVLGGLAVAAVVGALVVGAIVLAPVLLVVGIIALPVILVGLFLFQFAAPFILAGLLATILVVGVGAILAAAAALVIGVVLTALAFVIAGIAAVVLTALLPPLALVLGPLLFTGALAVLVIGLLLTAAAVFGVLLIGGLVFAALAVVTGLLSLLTPFGLLALPILAVLVVAAVILFAAVGLIALVALPLVFIAGLVLLGIAAGVTVTWLLLLALVGLALASVAGVIMGYLVGSAAKLLAIGGLVVTALVLVFGTVAAALLILGLPIIGPFLAPLFFLGLVALPIAFGLFLMLGGLAAGIIATVACVAIGLTLIAGLAAAVLVGSLFLMVLMPYAIPIILLADIVFAAVVAVTLGLLTIGATILTLIEGGAFMLLTVAAAVIAVGLLFVSGFLLTVVAFVGFVLAALFLLVFSPPLFVLASPLIFGAILLGLLAMIATTMVAASVVALGVAAAVIGFGIVWGLAVLAFAATLVLVTGLFPPLWIVSIPLALAIVAVLFVAIAAAVVLALAVTAAIFLIGNALALVLGVIAVAAVAIVGVVAVALAAVLSIPYLLLFPIAVFAFPAVALALLVLLSPVLAIALAIAAVAALVVLAVVTLGPLVIGGLAGSLFVVGCVLFVGAIALGLPLTFSWPLVFVSKQVDGPAATGAARTGRRNGELTTEEIVAGLQDLLRPMPAAAPVAAEVPTVGAGVTDGPVRGSANRLVSVSL
ncbi:hypothetical protein [Nocardia sp. NPDC020380]|uniref:hypothetical protein n=1 Tax=Nocardia sp. NPDC020380 TaxID=3364309 RepID=UPI0037A49740